MRDLKYLAAYIGPALAYWSVYAGGIHSYSTLLFVFLFVPIIEAFMSNDSGNLSPQERDVKSNKWIFDFLLYLNVPIVYGLIIFYLYTLKTFNLSTMELIGMVTAVGLTLGSAGINVAHELGHRQSKISKVLSVILLLPSLYSHFIIEHNLGHHKNVGTDLDPASAKKGENLYGFWMRSVVLSYLHAWKIAGNMAGKHRGLFKLLFNKMVVLTMLQFLFLLLIFLYGGQFVFIIYILTAIFSFLMLETINYIEHYGLRRSMLENGRYERVQAHHSWNSNHELGRILLYELTRHSDHHYLANKKYQLLDHHESAKQLPVGYPASMLLSMLPPLWFAVMDKRI